MSTGALNLIGLKCVVVVVVIIITIIILKIKKAV